MIFLLLFKTFFLSARYTERNLLSFAFFLCDIIYTVYKKRAPLSSVFPIRDVADNDRKKKRNCGRRRRGKEKKQKRRKKTHKKCAAAQITDMEKKEKRRIVSGVRLPDDRENAFPGIKGEIQK